MEPERLKSTIESLLFVSSKPLKVKELAKILEQQEFAVQAVLDQLVGERKASGVVILENSGEYQLATNSNNSTAVKTFLNAELREKLTDATVEVLAIIAYRQPISKAELEAIRGVNSQYSLRNLLMRGLIEKTPNPQDARSFLYQTTTEFLMHLGLNSVKDLPAFEKLVGEIKLPDAPQSEKPISMPAAAPSGQNIAVPAIAQQAMDKAAEQPPKDELGDEGTKEYEEGDDKDEE
jgi:segregation and condensation protein B